MGSACAFFALQVQCGFSFGLFGFKCGELLAQLAHQVGGGFQRFTFKLQFVDFNSQTGPVQLVVITEIHQPDHILKALSKGFLRGLQTGNLRAQIGQLRFTQLEFAGQRGNLAGVGPAQHVTAAVIEPVAVVFFMAFTGSLDLPGTGDGFFFTLKLHLCAAAGDVKTLADLSVQPFVKR